LIENPYLKIADPAKRYPSGQTLNLEGIKGVFVGTDYSFCHSKKMQDTILGNCID